MDTKKFFVSISIVMLLSFVKGFVVMKLWNWFIVPLGFPIISFIWAMGISLTISYLTLQSYKAEEDVFKNMLNSAVSSILAIIIGFILHLYM